MVTELPTRGGYVPELDGVRAVAVTMVLLHHCIIVPQQGIIAWGLRHALPLGGFGVDLFFALSGYLITSILMRAKSKPHYFRNFYARRFLRIFPLYYAIILILASFAAWLPFGPLRPAWPYLSYVSNLWLVFTLREWPPLGHTWSLAIEEQFYLFYPIVVLRLDKGRLRYLLWSVIALSPLVRLITATQIFPTASVFATFCRLDVLAMGALIAVELDGRTEISDRVARLLRLAFWALVTVTAFLWLTKQLDFRKLFFNAAGLTIVDGAATLFVCLVLLSPGSPLSRVLRLPLVVGVGRISYGIYLIHYPIVRLTETYARGSLPDTWSRTAVIATTSVTATAIASVLSWFLFERPILRLKKWFYEKGEAAAQVEVEMLETAKSS
jgi:peptidoglycan/LPS O-acetylase OafA/YrhL